MSKRENDNQSRSEGKLLSMQPIETEAALLCLMMVVGECIEEVCGLVSVNDFSTMQHKDIYTAIVETTSNGLQPDITLIAEWFDKHSSFDQREITTYLLHRIDNTIPFPRHAIEYAKIVKDKSVLRQLYLAGMLIADSACRQYESIPDLLDAAEQSLYNISSGAATGGLVQAKNYIDSVITELETAAESHTHVTGISSGYSAIDELTCGWQKQELIILAARPSMGKTSLSLNMALFAAIQKQTIAFYSLEQRTSDLIRRLISAKCRINGNKIRTGRLSEQQWSSTTRFLGELSSLKLYIDDTRSLSVADIRISARQLKSKHGLSMIFIDYLQLIQGNASSNNPNEEINNITSALRQLAKELDVPVICLSQLNRSLESRTDKRPIQSDLRGSGSIEQIADVVVFIYRDEVYHADSPDKGTAEIIVGKQRNGPVGTAVLGFDHECTLFLNQ